MNLKHPKVSAHKSVWYSTIFGIVFYCFIGIFGGLGFQFNADSNLLQEMYASSMTNGGNGWMTLIYILFPILTYITSIPVSMIVVRLNFRAAKLCNEGIQLIMIRACNILGGSFPILDRYTTSDWISCDVLWHVHKRSFSINLQLFRAIFDIHVFIKA